MRQLLYADEVRPLAEVSIPAGQSSEAELKLASQVVEQIASDSFDPAAYRNDVRERMQSEIERKVAGHQVSVSAAPEQPAQIIDLMEALKASLAARGQPAVLGKRELGERKPPRSAAPHGVRSKARASRG